MQAAGRLRLLGRGQTLRIAGTPDVTAKICGFNGLPLTSRPRATGGPDAQHVLQWVMHNKVQASLNGIFEWSRQGLSFASTEGNPDAVRQPEMLQLREMYAGGRAPQPVGDVVARMARSHLDQPAADGMAIMFERVAERSRRDGSGHLVVAGQQVADEEC